MIISGKLKNKIMQKKGIKIEMATMADKLNSEYEALLDGEKKIAGEVNSMLKEIDKKLSLLMILSDRVFFEYDGLKGDIEGMIGKEAADAWDKNNNGMFNYANMVQKQIAEVRNGLKGTSYK